MPPVWKNTVAAPHELVPTYHGAAFFLWPPTVVTLVACLFLIILDPTRLAFGIAATLLLPYLTYVAIAYPRLTRLVADLQRTKSELDSDSAANVDAELPGLYELCTTALPIWSRQIQTSRSETEDAIVSLSIQFSNIVSRLKSARNTSQNISIPCDESGAQLDIVNVTNLSRERLNLLLESLEFAFVQKRQMVSEVQQLRALTEELKGMAADVASIAEKTNLLALNAAIEAARAGEHGRGFSVVADEVRSLSSMSAAAGNKMTQKIALITGAINQVIESTERSAAEDERIQGDSHHTVTRVLGNYQCITEALAESAANLQQENDGIAKEIEEVLVSLQFQDRTAQILSHVIEQLDELHVELDGNQQRLARGESVVPLDAERWIERMSADYTVTQERRNAGDEQQDRASEVYFF